MFQPMIDKAAKGDLTKAARYRLFLILGFWSIALCSVSFAGVLRANHLSWGASFWGGMLMFSGGLVVIVGITALVASDL